MDFEKLTFRQIEAGTEIKPFDCGDPDLNGFLFEDANEPTRAMYFDLRYYKNSFK